MPANQAMRSKLDCGNSQAPCPQDYANAAGDDSAVHARGQIFCHENVLHGVSATKD